ncbi:hypothetical protein FO519_007211, partial [Halicephalobus sp. NKZ332]
MKDFFKHQIGEHESQIDFTTEAEPTDFVEHYLRKKRDIEKEGEFDLYSDEQLYGVCFDLWLAGQETTANTIIWGIIYLIENFHTQKRLQEELDTVVGSERLIVA